MSIAEIIKAECKNQKIPVSRLEKDLGFCNGYVRGLKDKIPLDRAQDVARYLGIPLSTLTGDEPDEEGYYIDPETQTLVDELAQNRELRAVFDVVKGMSKERLSAIYNLLKDIED